MTPWMWGALVGCRAGLVSPVPAPAEDPSAAWEAALGRAVVDGYVDYDVLEAERDSLDAYVAWIGTDESRPEGRRERLPYLINAYNALVLFSVLEHGRPTSVKAVDGVLPVDGSRFFLEEAFLVGGQWVSLWQLEHEDLRGRYLDERVHAALNCASMSCPPLRPTLYTLKGLEVELNDQMRVWLSDEARGMRLDGDRVLFSAIFDWYARDFDLWTGGEDLCTQASRFVGPRDRRALRAAAAAGCPHGYLDYDWALNHRLSVH